MMSTALMALFAVSASPALADPRFSDFPALEVLEGEAVHPDYAADAAMYRTMIRRGIEDGPNAGGHYAIVPIGCGGGCSVVVMVDLRNGALLDFPVGGEEYYQLALGFERDSRLIVADWKDPSDGAFNTCVRRFYEITDGDIAQIGETRRAVGDYTSCSE
ncbi:hypothetical protein NFE57_12145 [Hephaestia sp. MAHUQ-44]|nr:hypothetical protein [Hephaestia sp. MAHUQ-44]